MDPGEDGATVMAAKRSGRWTHQHDGDVVVFLIGMRVNQWWRLRQWWPVFVAMPRMLRELYDDPGSGLLGHRLLIGAGGPVVVQYWSDAERLVAYARAADRKHRPAWQRFNAGARTADGAVGIWHETYVVPAGSHESIYVATPVAGLAAATASVPAGRAGGPGRAAT